MKREFPVYGICKFSYSQQEDVVVKSLAPYLKAMRKLHFPHRHDFYHFILFTKGGGSHSIDFEKFTIHPYQVYFMAPGQVHGWDFEGDVDGYVINFSADFFKSFLLNGQYLDHFPFLRGNAHYSVLDIPGQDRDEIIRIMEKALMVADSSGKFRLDTLRIILLEFFFLVAKTKGESDEIKNSESHNHGILRNYEKLIEQHYLDHRLPKYYAELLCVTPSYLNTVCKELLGLSAGNVVRNRIVLEAKRMLINFDLTVTEIAYELNFNDNSYFCKFFRNQAGISPETFRKSI